MRLLLDQGLPRSTVFHLRKEKIDALHVGELGLASASDSQILDLGLREDRVVVTLDADFHALLALSGAKKPSVIRIRIVCMRKITQVSSSTSSRLVKPTWKEVRWSL